VREGRLGRSTPEWPTGLLRLPARARSCYLPSRPSSAAYEETTSERCRRGRSLADRGRGAGLPGGLGSFVGSIHSRLFGEFLDPAIDRLIEGVDPMLPHKLHEFGANVGGAVNMEVVPREFQSISLNDHSKELS